MTPNPQIGVQACFLVSLLFSSSSISSLVHGFQSPLSIAFAHSIGMGGTGMKGMGALYQDYISFLRYRGIGATRVLYVVDQLEDRFSRAIFLYFPFHLGANYALFGDTGKIPGVIMAWDGHLQTARA